MKKMLSPFAFRFYLWLLDMNAEQYFDLLGRDWKSRQETTNDLEWLGATE